MAGAALVLVLAGLAFPIALLLGAVVFDALLVLWVLGSTWHDEWWPQFRAWNGRWYDALLRHRPHWHHRPHAM